MASVVRDSIESYDKALEKMISEKLKLDKTFKTYLLVAYEIIKQTGDSIIFPSPWNEYAEIKLEKNGATKISGSGGRGGKTVLSYKITNPVSLYLFLETLGGDEELNYRIVRTAVNEISKTPLGKKIPPKMVKKILEELMEFCI